MSLSDGYLIAGVSAAIDGLRYLSYVLLAALFSAQIAAQDLEPRSYTNLPVGLNFLGLGYAYSEGELNPSPSVPLKDVDLTIEGTVLAYARTLSLAGRSARVDATASRLCFEGQGEFNGTLIKGDRCGTGDPAVRLSYNFYGAPAMGLKQFSQRAPGLVVGGSLKVHPPLGDYNNENLINSGSNRWTFKPEVGLSNGWGKWHVDAAFAARLFGDNNNFYGDTKLEQDPLYQVQAHLIYTLRRGGRWVSLNGNYFWGGRTHKNGIKSDDLQKNSRIGVTLAWPLNAQHSLKFYASRGVVTRIGNDSDNVGIVWQYRWGKGS